MPNESIDRYRSQVNHAVETAREAVEEHSLLVSDAIQDACDGYPVYHSEALDILRNCDTSPNEVDVYNVEYNVEYNVGWDTIHRIAFECFRADVRKEYTEKYK